MYLIHATDPKYLFNILKEGELKSSYLSRKINQGEGVYKIGQQNHVFFSCISKKDFENFSKRNFPDYQMYLIFDSSLLHNRVFFIGDGHHSTPEKTDKKYDRYTKQKIIDNSLKKIYEKSLKMETNIDNIPMFMYFQQIAIRNKCNLKKLVGVKINHHTMHSIESKIVNYLEKNYPDVSIF